MKQFVIDQMKEYQRRSITVKAVKYQEGMEDAWMVEYQAHIEDNDGIINDTVDKLFWTKESAEEYMKQEHPEDNPRGLFCEYTEVIPVLLREVSEDEYVEGCLSITQDGKFYEYDTLTDDSYIVIDGNGYFYGDYDTEMFFREYEAPLNKTTAHIGYDKECESLYVENNCFRVYIDETEVATVEKLLEGFEIPFTEKIGQVLISKGEIHNGNR